VRNPVAAAMSACSFVKTALNEDEPLKTEEQKQETRDDIKIIDNALKFVNDLLRSMLDMHRAADKQLKVNLTPTDIKLDVLESVHSMLPQRDPKFRVQVECPDGLMVMTDRLRLKQVCLNLSRNSVKFISEGFIRLRAETIDNEVCVIIEDSGPGIPSEKRGMLFREFQESLDSLSQGTVRTLQVMAIGNEHPFIDAYPFTRCLLLDVGDWIVPLQKSGSIDGWQDLP
jgi:signal transduction histidine kinase